MLNHKKYVQKAGGVRRAPLEYKDGKQTFLTTRNRLQSQHSANTALFGYAEKESATAKEA